MLSASPQSEANEEDCLDTIRYIAIDTIYSIDNRLT